MMPFASDLGTTVSVSTSEVSERALRGSLRGFVGVWGARGRIMRMAFVMGSRVMGAEVGMRVFVVGVVMERVFLVEGLVEGWDSVPPARALSLEVRPSRR